MYAKPSLQNHPVNMYPLANHEYQPDWPPSTSRLWTPWWATSWNRRYRVTDLFSMSTNSWFSHLNWSTSPYARIVVSPDNNSAKCKYRHPLRIASARTSTTQRQSEVKSYQVAMNKTLHIIQIQTQMNKLAYLELSCTGMVKNRNATVDT